MPTAPEPYLTAGLDTVRWALICCRNWTLNDDVPVKQVNDLMEAIHEVPAMLINWRSDSLDEIRTHLGCFQFQHWRNLTGDTAVSTPDLVAWFNRRLTEIENQT